MSTLVRLEFYKCRRRQIFLICAGLLGAELVWFGVYLARQDPEDLLQGWMLTLYNLAMVDAILFPLAPPSWPAGTARSSTRGPR